MSGRPISDIINNYVGTDLVCESGRIPAEDYSHAKYFRYGVGAVTVERLSVDDEAACAECGHAIGRYVTVSGAFSGKQTQKDAARAVAKELSKMAKNALGRKIGKGTKVLVACLGNRRMTPDSLGAKCADKINATGRAAENVPELDALGCADVSVITPGVLGQTGIESSDYIRGIAEGISPDLVIVIDAMAARSTGRLASTVQISDVGISPGRGVGNARAAVNREALGCPVIGVGSPTVVGSSTLVCDALAQAGITEISPALEKVLDGGLGFFVSPGNCDEMIENLSDIISRGVNDVLGTTVLS